MVVVSLIAYHKPMASYQHAYVNVSGQGEIPARASGHGAIPPVKVISTMNCMCGASTSVGVVPLVGDNETSPIVEGGSIQEYDASGV